MCYRRKLLPLAGLAAADAKTTWISMCFSWTCIYRNLPFLSLHQFLNGWMQNVNAYDSSSPLGVYFNLNVC